MTVSLKIYEDTAELIKKARVKVLKENPDMKHFTNDILNYVLKKYLGE